MIKFQKIQGKLYTYSTSLTTKQLVILYVDIKTETDGNDNKIIFHGHLNLRI